MVEIIDIETGEIHSLECISPNGSDVAADIIGGYCLDRTDDGKFVMSIAEINFWRDALPRITRIDETVEMLADRFGWDVVEEVLARVNAQADRDLPAWLDLAERLLRELEEGET